MTVTWYKHYQELFANCVFYLPLNGNTSEIIVNRSVTAYGSPTYTNLGNNRSALTLVAANSQYITTPYAAVSSMLFGANNYTICMWVNLVNPTSSNNYLLDGRLTGGYLTPMAIYLGTLGKVIIDISSGGSSWISEGTSNTALSANTWYLLTFTRNGSTFGYYLDCVSDITMSATSSIALYASNTNLYFGSVASSGFTNGMFGPIAIWIGRMLTIPEMKMYRIKTHPITGTTLYPIISGIRGVE
ncbi:MAG: LamG-like jellyroll fold domain-containing protein [Dehalococcoidales bacterium]|jgi:hypothetical protein